MPRVSRRRTPAALALIFGLVLPVCCLCEQTRHCTPVRVQARNFTNPRASPFDARQGEDDLVDATLLPDFWNSDGWIDARIKTNGDTPEQLVKVTDRRHRFPLFATVCSLAFLLTIIAIIVVCTH